MPEITFDGIPSNLRIPGSYLEFNSSLAGNSAIAFKVLVIGQRLAAGTVAEGVPTLVNNGEEAEDFFGRGSMLAEQIHALKNANAFIETWAIALDEAAAGTAATGTITVTGTATEAGTLPIYIGGRKVAVAVANGDDQDAMATAIAAAITADTRLSVTAVVNGVTTNQVDLTCRWKGETGNDIDLRHSYYSEALPAGTALAYGAMAGGATNADLSVAIAAMADEWYNWIVMPYTDAANLTLLDTELDDRWGPLRQIGGRAFCAHRDTLANTGTFGNSRNNPHVTCMGTNTSPQPPYIWAAVNAIVAASSLSIDPARPLQTLSLTGIMAPAVGVRWNDAERNTLLYDGIATYKVQSDGTVVIERQITTYQTNGAGVADDAYLDINTPETLERIRYEQRSYFASKFPRHKLAGDDVRVGPGQPIMQPKIAKTHLLGLYQGFIDSGWCQDYDGYKDALVVQINGSDPTRLDIVDSPKLIGQLRVHAQQIQFRR